MGTAFTLGRDTFDLHLAKVAISDIVKADGLLTYCRRQRKPYDGSHLSNHI
jgi:hypothetical protein